MIQSRSFYGLLQVEASLRRLGETEEFLKYGDTQAQN
jgi:hypothetical protein